MDYNEHSTVQWNRLEDKLFEEALVRISHETLNRWQVIANQIPGKSAIDVFHHFQALIHDVEEIESGRFIAADYSDDTDESLESDSGDEMTSDSKPKKKRQRGNPWTHAEHRQFLVGMKTYGRGDWRSISRYCVITRTPSQVASHAQKYFNRLQKDRRGKKRNSIFDLNTTGPVTSVAESRNAPTSTQLAAPILNQNNLEVLQQVAAPMFDQTNLEVTHHVATPMIDQTNLEATQHAAARMTNQILSPVPTVSSPLNHHGYELQFSDSQNLMDYHNY